jgi:Ca-activated chloride channel family protein
MKIFKYTLLVLSLGFILPISAKVNERDFIRHGNRYYRDSLYQKAEINYRKALEKNPRSTQAMYNLGNALLMQQKFKEAMQQYETASKIEKNKLRGAYIFHNAGVIFQSQKQYGEAIQMYKESLRRNPNDNETRYNLVLCQRLLKNNPQQGGGSNKKNKDQKNQNKQQNQQKQNKDKQDKSQQKQQKPQQNQMSKDNAEQLLNAAMDDEKDTQRKLQKVFAPPRSKKLEKNW